MRKLVVAAALTLVATAAGAREEAWHSELAQSRVVVHVVKKGLFSGFAHDHHFEATDWSATATFDDARLEDVAVELTVSAASLRDTQPALSEKERVEVNARAAGPEVLDAGRHPSIAFRSQRLELAPGATRERFHGTLHGTLTLRGRSGPASIALDAERDEGTWRVRGSTRVSQTSFGIRPFSAFGGTVGVEDEVRIDFSLMLVRPHARLSGAPG